MKIYIDFDRTLFDCETFLRDFYTIVKKYDIPKKVFMKYQNQCKKKGFNPYIILDKIVEEYHFDAKIYDEISDLIKKSNEYLYPDSIAFLKHLRMLNYQVIILTKGNIDYQKEKIINSNIADYYDELIVTMKHKGDLDLDYQNSIFIDDNPMEIESILKRIPKKVIRIKRKGSKYFDVIVEKVQEIVNLGELIENNIL